MLQIRFCNFPMLCILNISPFNYVFINSPYVKVKIYHKNIKSSYRISYKLKRRNLDT